MPHDYHASRLSRVQMPWPTGARVEAPLARYCHRHASRQPSAAISSPQKCRRGRYTGMGHFRPAYIHFTCWPVTSRHAFTAWAHFFSDGAAAHYIAPQAAVGRRLPSIGRQIASRHWDNRTLTPRSFSRGRPSSTSARRYFYSARSKALVIIPLCIFLLIIAFCLDFL